MTNSITVHYGRKRTDKLQDGSFDAFEVGGDLTAEVDDSVNPIETWGQVFAGFKGEIDKAYSAHFTLQQERVTSNVIQSVPAPAPEPQRMDAPVPRPSGPLSWVKDTVDRETSVIQQKIQALPGEHISGGGGVGDEHGTPLVSAIQPNVAVMYTGARVFEATVKQASNGNDYGTLRVGKRGPDGIPGQYATARSFDPAIVKQIDRTREGDMVDVYGYWKPWKNNPDKFDLELQKLEISE